MRIFVRDKSFYKLLWSIAFPIAMQNLITFGVSMMDSVMLGALGDVQLSAATIANQLFFIFMGIMFGVSGGANVMVAQYWGKGDVDMIKRIFAAMYRFVIIVSILAASTAFFFPGAVMSLFTKDAAVIAEGINYLKIVAFLYVFYGLSNCTLCVLRSVGTVKISVLVYGTSLVTNTTLNYILIFGKLGFEPMGVRGAAIATLISRVIEFIITAWFVFKKEEKLKITLHSIVHAESGVMGDFLKNAVPVIFNELLWSSGAAMLSVVIGRIGTEFVAANSVCSVVVQLMLVMTTGVSSACAVIIGNTIGEGNRHKVMERAVTFIALGLILGMCSALLMFTLRPVAISFYNISETSKQYAYQIMAVASVIMFFQTMSIVGMMGVLRGGGDVHFVLVADVIFMWVLAIPLGFVTGLWLRWPVAAVYLVLKCDEFFKSVIGVIRVISGKWIKDVTKSKPSEELSQA